MAERFPVRRRFWTYLRLGFAEQEALQLTAKDMGLPRHHEETWTLHQLAIFDWLRWMSGEAQSSSSPPKP